MVDYPGSVPFSKMGWCLGYRYIVSLLRQNGYSAEILYPLPLSDRGSVKRYLIGEIMRRQPRSIGFTAYDIQLTDLLAFILELRKAGCRSHITLGGLCVSFIPHEILSKYRQVDSVVRGEGELSILDLAERVKRSQPLEGINGLCYRKDQKVVIEKPRALIDKLDDLPFPCKDQLDPSLNGSPLRYYSKSILMSASRGCYGKCSFCSIQAFFRACPGKMWRARSAENVVQEIKSMMKVTGYDRVSFMDDNFMGPGRIGIKHAQDMADGIINEKLKIQFNFACRSNDIQADIFGKLKAAGLVAVTIGAESASEGALKLYNKWVKPEDNYRAINILEKLGICTEIDFIFFNPLTTLQEIKQNLAFVDRVSKSKYAYLNKFNTFAQLQPLNGSPIIHKLKELKLLKGDHFGYKIEYKDKRVGMIAKQINKIPVLSLYELISMTQAHAGRNADAKCNYMREYGLHLSLFRLPELVGDLAKLLTVNKVSTNKKVSVVIREIEKEEKRLKAVINEGFRDLSHT